LLFQFFIGVDGFLPKPFSLDDLIAAIADVEKTMVNN
jgi:DNA-binding NarL/FixJ family response regulator